MRRNINDDFTQRFAENLGRQVKAKAADPFLASSLDSEGTKKELADAFIDLVVDESVLLQNIQVHRTDSPAGDRSSLNITGPVTEAASENEEGTNTRRPSNTSQSYSTVKMRSMLDLTGELQEDNIEGPRGKNTITNMMVKAIANDMEQLAIEGDDSVSGSDDVSRLVGANDGFKVLTDSGTGARIVNAAGTQPSDALMSLMIRTMPTKWKKDKSKLRFIMSDGASQSLMDEYASRSTAYGDEMRRTGVMPAIRGIQPLIIPLIPEDLTFSGTDGTTGTFIWLCDPTQFVYVIQRDFSMEWERKARYDRDEMTVYMRTDYLVETADAIVRADNVSIWTEHGFYGESE
jgi:hypothetical protein